MLVTTQWPLKRAATSPHLSGFVFYGCLESLTELSALCVWINDWANNREAGDLRRQHGHYDVIVMRWYEICWDQSYLKQRRKLAKVKPWRVCILTSLTKIYSNSFYAISRHLHSVFCQCYSHSLPLNLMKEVGNSDKCCPSRIYNCAPTP